MVSEAHAPGRSAVRAQYMQNFVARIAELPPKDRDAIRERISANVHADIKRARALDWLPIAHNLECTHAVSQGITAAATHEFFEKLLLSAFEAGLLKAFIIAVQKAAGRDPGRYVAWLNRGFPIIFRDCGEWSVLERERDSATVAIAGLPLEFARDRIWLQSVASSLYAGFVLARTDGAVTIREIDPAAGRAVFRLRWNPVE